MKSPNSVKTIARSAPANGGKRVKVDWAFRRLRHQAAKFLSRGDPRLQRELATVLQRPRTYTEMQREVMRYLGPRRAAIVWNRFLDEFFGHRINKRVGA